MLCGGASLECTSGQKGEEVAPCGEESVYGRGSCVSAAHFRASYVSSSTGRIRGGGAPENLDGKNYIQFSLTEILHFLPFSM